MSGPMGVAERISARQTWTEIVAPSPADCLCGLRQVTSTHGKGMETEFSHVYLNLCHTAASPGRKPYSQAIRNLSSTQVPSWKLELSLASSPATPGEAKSCPTF